MGIKLKIKNYKLQIKNGSGALRAMLKRLRRRERGAEGDRREVVPI